VLVPIMEEVAAKRGSRLIVADPESVTDEELEKFDYIAFKENVAIALVVAELAGVPRDVAFKGMWAAEPDPGVLRMKELKILGKRVTWANLFAVNDRESMTVAMEKLVPFMTDDTTTVGILNNRTDRERRAVQFAEVAVQDLDFMRLVTFGAFEGLVTDLLVQNGYPLDHIINLGDTHSPPVETIVDRMIGQMPTSHVLVVGFVNIHTHQAEMMLDYFENIAEPWVASSGAAADRARRSSARLPLQLRDRAVRLRLRHLRVDDVVRALPPHHRLDCRTGLHRRVPGVSDGGCRHRSSTPCCRTRS
jgi:poly-gamma-glutamate synthase PgsB/CapB